MAHVGIERLGPGHRQEDAAQDDEAEEAVLEQEAHAVDAGDSARRTPRSSKMCSRPAAARLRNQTAVIGPKKRPRRPVPRLCTMNRAIRMHAR